MLYIVIIYLLWKIKTPQDEDLTVFCLCLFNKSWSWRGSNPRPNKATICFLHAYPALIVGSDQVADSRVTPYLL